jgi:hypothetical protein
MSQVAVSRLTMTDAERRRWLGLFVLSGCGDYYVPDLCRLCHRSHGTGAVRVGGDNRVTWMVRGRVWRGQAFASAAGWGSRMARSQSTVRLMPSVRSVSGFQPSTRAARVGSNALA